MTVSSEGNELQNSVSRETLGSLRIYVQALKKWSRALNLVSPSTLDDIWRRHIEDSLQIGSYLPPSPARVVDFGSGAGFPGLVLAAIDKHPDRITLVEADQRKATFLRNAAREMGIKVKVENARIERIPPLEADVAVARALAPLPELLSLVYPHLSPGGLCLFLKGRQVEKEVNKALEAWSFSHEIYPSSTDEHGAILKLSNISRV